MAEGPHGGANWYKERTHVLRDQNSGQPQSYSSLPPTFEDREKPQPHRRTKEDTRVSRKRYASTAKSQSVEIDYGRDPSSSGVRTRASGRKHNKSTLVYSSPPRSLEQDSTSLPHYGASHEPQVTSSHHSAPPSFHSPSYRTDTLGQTLVVSRGDTLGVPSHGYPYSVTAPVNRQFDQTTHPVTMTSMHYEVSPSSGLQLQAGAVRHQCQTAAEPPNSHGSSHHHHPSHSRSTAMPSGAHQAHGQYPQTGNVPSTRQTHGPQQHNSSSVPAQPTPSPRSGVVGRDLRVDPSGAHWNSGQYPHVQTGREPSSRQVHEARSQYSSASVPTQPTPVPHSGVVGHDSRRDPSFNSASSRQRYATEAQCSIANVKNERYALDEESTSDHDNEDRYLIYKYKEFMCLGVFDGHNGDRAAQFVCEYFKNKVFATNSWRQIFDSGSLQEQYLVEVFKVVENDFFKSISKYIDDKNRIQRQIPIEFNSYQAQLRFPDLVAHLQNLEDRITGGCTAALAIVSSDKIYVANAGDSRVVLAYVREDRALVTRQLSVDHSVENEEELERLAALGLDRKQLKNSGRLGTQENTRSIGDYSIKGGYKDVDVLRDAIDVPGTAVPFISTTDIDPASFRFLIIMSDGVYKTLEAITCDQNGERVRDGNEVIAGMIDYCFRKMEFPAIASHLLKKIRNLQYNRYQETARLDRRSPIATANRKRDDMTLMIYSFQT